MRLNLLRYIAIIMTSTIFTPSNAAGITDSQHPGQAGSNGNRMLETAIFAGGCFWCMEPPFDKLQGVISTTSGYTAGHTINPGYKQVSSGSTGHTEAIQVTFDPKMISYEELLAVFWKNIDPVALNRQFCDSGTQYRSGIYFRDSAQEKAARKSLQDLEQKHIFKQKIATEIEPASTFYPAEEYHQNYYIKNPIRYKFYRYSCGRDQRLQDIWMDQ